MIIDAGHILMTLHDICHILVVANKAFVTSLIGIFFLSLEFSKRFMYIKYKHFIKYMENISSQYMVLSFCFLNSIVQEELLIF